LFWKDLKPRPQPLVRHSCPELSTKRKGSPIKLPIARTQTLPPDKYAHPYRRVHYQRDVPRRTSSEQRWQKTDSEFRDFLAALPPIHRAAATGNVVKLAKLLGDEDNDGMNWKVPSHSLYRYDRTGWDFTGAPAIHFAAYYGHDAAVLYLLSCGADIDAKDAAGTTALHATAWTGNADLFQILLEKGADSSICDYDGWSVAICAMSRGHDSISRLLLEHSGGDEDMLVKTYKLRHAAKSGNSDTVLGMLLEEQAAHGHGQTSELFLSEALFGAAEGGHEVLVQVLLEKGADPAATDNTGSTALHWAGWGGHTEIGNLMYDEKDDVDTSDGQGEGLASRLRLTSPHHESVIRMLLRKRVDINTQNSQGCTLLHWVSGAGSVPMVKFLLDNEADINIVDSSGRTAFDRAKKTGDDCIIKLLQPE
jgi:ankyrin repeat protein